MRTRVIKDLNLILLQTLKSETENYLSNGGKLENLSLLLKDFNRDAMIFIHDKAVRNYPSKHMMITKNITGYNEATIWRNIEKK